MFLKSTRRRGKQKSAEVFNFRQRQGVNRFIHNSTRKAMCKTDLFTNRPEIKRCQIARSYSPLLSSESFCMKKLCKYEFNCGSFLKQTFRAAEARWESILVKMFLKLVFKSCSGMSLLAVAAGSSFRPAGAQIKLLNL